MLSGRERQAYGLHCLALAMQAVFNGYTASARSRSSLLRMRSFSL